MEQDDQEAGFASEGGRGGDNLPIGAKILSLLKSSVLLSKPDEHWMENQRGALLVVATVLMTVSFQGAPVMANHSGDGFIYLMALLTICFSTSLAVAFILASELPMRNKFFLSVLSLGLSMSLLTLSLAFAGFVYHLTPESMYTTTSYNLVVGPLYFLIALITAIFGYSTIRTLAWIVGWCVHAIKMSEESKVLPL